jgi:hypothetical protein
VEKRKIHTRSEKGQELIELDMNSKKAIVVNQESYSDPQLYVAPAGNTLGKTPSDGTIFHSGEGGIDDSYTYEGGILKIRSLIGRSLAQTVEIEKNVRQIQKELFPDREAQIKETNMGAERIQLGRSTPSYMRGHEIETVPIIYEEKSLYGNTSKKDNSPFRCCAKCKAVAVNRKYDYRKNRLRKRIN